MPVARGRGRGATSVHIRRIAQDGTASAGLTQARLNYDSCTHASLPSDTYTVQPSGGSPVTVYCDIDNEECDGGVWMRVASYNYSDSSTTWGGGGGGEGGSGKPGLMDSGNRSGSHENGVFLVTVT